MATARTKKTEAPAEPPERNLDPEFDDIVTALSQPLDPETIKSRVGYRDRNGNQRMVEYIEWMTACDLLDQYAGQWRHAIKDVRIIGQWVAVIVSLTVAGVTREGMGLGVADSEMGIKKAEHDALKRAAVKFGVARELYRHEENDGGGQGNWQNQGQSQPQSNLPRPQNTQAPIQQGYAAPTGFPANPIAQNLAEMVTTKQLGMIRAVARETALDADAICAATCGCAVSELSRKGASALIEYLKNGGSFNGQDSTQTQMPSHTGALPPKLPSPNPQPASVQQGRFATVDQVKAINMLCQQKGYAANDIAMSFSQARTNDVGQLSEAEAGEAIKALNAG